MTLYVVQARGTDAAALTRAHFIKDGFAWGGFAFGWLWLAYHRLWLATVLYIAFEVVVLVWVRPHVTPGALLVLDFLVRLYVGFEGSKLREAKGARRAVLSEIVEARDHDAAEVAFFARHGSGLRDGAA